MRLLTLLENTCECEDLIPQHGLSLYIETGNRKILFDMGQDDTFIRNGEKLGVDLSQVDLAILSHGHYDHGGGLKAFLQINEKAPVYLHTDAFDSYFNGTEKYIGLDTSAQEDPRLIVTRGSMELAEGLTLHDCNEQAWSFDSWGLNRLEGENFRPDDFRHEQYLLVEEGEKRILISGCSHKGIVNIARHFSPDILIGGFHLSKQENLRELETVCRQLLATNTCYYTGHCTGEKQFAFMKNLMGDRLQKLSTGILIEV